MTNTPSSSPVESAAAASVPPPPPVGHRSVPPSQRPVSVESTAARVLGPLAWLTHVLKYLPYIGYGKVLRFERDVYAMTRGEEILQWWSDHLMLGVDVEGLEHLPASGAVVLYCNHPTGLTDGIAVWDAIKAKRPDMKIMMNAQGLDPIPAFHDLLVPVRLGKDGKTSDSRSTWRGLLRALRAQSVVMLCPGGRLSQLDWFGDWDVHEVAWQRGLEKMARDYPDVTFLPVFIEGRVRKHYYLLHRLFPALRDVWLYTEFHSKRNWPYRIKILAPAPIESAAQAQALVESQKRKKWYQLPRRKPR